MAAENYFLVIALLVMFGFVFFQNKRRKTAADNLAASLKVGATVVTYSGIIGTIEKLDEKTAVIKTAGSSVEFMRGAIRNVETPAAPAKPAAKSTAKKPAAK